MTHHFVLEDVLLTSISFILLALFFIIPGFLLGWVFDLVGFVERRPIERLALSIIFSVSLLPVVVYLIGRTTSMNSVWLLFLALWIGFLIKCIRNRHWPIPRLPAVVWGIALTWLIVSVFSLVDLQIGRKLYFSVVSYDYNFRTAVIAALGRATSLPASNPFFHPGHDVAFRYHYFWFLMCSLPVRFFALITPRNALIAGSAWIGFALFATIYSYLAFFFTNRKVTRRTAFLAVALLGISGLDIIPVLAIDTSALVLHRGPEFLPTVDWWNEDQVTGWFDSVLWVPHHVAALIACLTGFLIIWGEQERAASRVRWQAVGAAALAFSSAVGLSIYVTFVFVLGLAAWLATLLARRNRQQLLLFALSGFAALLFGLPFLLELLGSGAGTASFVRVGVRMFSPAHAVLFHFNAANRATIAIVDLVALPLNLFMELGVFFLIGVWKWKSLQNTQIDDADRASVTIAMSAGIACLFVRSGTIQTNDLGMRGMLIVQFFLVVWGASLLSGARASRPTPRQYRPLVRWLFTSTALLGVTTTVAEAFLIRVFPVLADRGIVPPRKEISKDLLLGERTYSLREVYDEVDRKTPGSAIVQHNPEGLQDLFAGLYSTRQMAIMSEAAATVFTSDPNLPSHIARPLVELFRNPKSEPSPLCRQLGIDILVVKDTDVVWKDTTSWAWRRPIVFRNNAGSAVRCEPENQASVVALPTSVP